MPNAARRGPRPQADELDARYGGPGALVGELDPLDYLRLEWAVAGAGGRRLDAVDRLDPLGDPAEHRVLAVQPGRCLGVDDEELGAVGVRTRVRHRECPANHLVLVDLILERVARTAGPGSLGTAALDHELRDHAVKDEPVVETV